MTHVKVTALMKLNNMHKYTSKSACAKLAG